MASMALQVKESSALAVTRSFWGDDGGEDGRARRIKQRTQSKLHDRECVEDPQLIGRADKYEAENDPGAQNIRQNQDPAPIKSIGQHAGNWAEQEERQKAGQEQRANRHAGVRQAGDQLRRGKQVEPVTKKRNNITQPKIAVIGISAQQIDVFS
jgi:hypothetical protein